MTIKIHNVIQGTEEWFQARCGMLTASEMKNILTPKGMDFADNDKSRNHVNTLLSQQLMGYAAPNFQTFDMMRGQEEERLAKIAYEKHYRPVTDVGFISNDKWGFTLGYSPDGLIGDDGTLECKSRLPKYQLETIVDGYVPAEYMAQIQTGLMVSERKWCDFISYSGGLVMYTARVLANPIMQEKIYSAALRFYAKVTEMKLKYYAALSENPLAFIATEKTVFDDISV